MLNTRKRVSLDLRGPEPPVYDPQEIYGILPADVRRPYEVRELISRLVDGSRFQEFKKRYGTSLVTGFAHLHGYPVAMPGVAVTEYCDEKRLTTRQRLELFLPACQAVQHAHQKGSSTAT